MLTDCGIPFDVMPDYYEGTVEALDSAIYHMKSRASPYALVVRRQCFHDYTPNER